MDDILTYKKALPLRDSTYGSSGNYEEIKTIVQCLLSVMCQAFCHTFYRHSLWSHSYPEFRYYCPHLQIRKENSERLFAHNLRASWQKKLMEQGLFKNPHFAQCNLCEIRKPVWSFHFYRYFPLRLKGHLAILILFFTRTINTFWIIKKYNSQINIFRFQSFGWRNFRIQKKSN